MAELKERANEKGAELVVIWVDTDVEVCRQRMIDRNSERDTWKLEHWDEYVAGRDYSIPTIFKDTDTNGELLIFNNNSTEESLIYCDIDVDTENPSYIISGGEFYGKYGIRIFNNSLSDIFSVG